ncbi:MAG: hypothetical protein PWP71_716 [Clostridia bacterium]|jgi:hypothetical protein|nr:hypothetical protein [Clostridia bacterium]
MSLKNKVVFKGIIYWVILMILLGFTNTGYCALAGDKLTTKDWNLAVLIILDQINIEDLAGEYPHIHKLMEQGATGLMNIRTAGRYNPASGYLTIGSGTRATVLGSGGQIFSFNETYEGEKAGVVFENFTGIKPSLNNILVLDLAQIIKENKKEDHEIIPGLLGEILKSKSVPVTVIGNADTPEEKNRLAGLIAMDTQGIVSGGNIGQSLVKKNTKSPFLVETDYEKLYEGFKQYKANGGLLIVHLGDTIRANSYHKYVSLERYQYFRKEALRKADEFIGKVIQDLDFSTDLLLLITPFPSFSGYSEKNLLTPFFMAGPGIKSGYAISATTRRQGVVANIDIAPTILSFFEQEVPQVMLGQPITSVKTNNVFEKLLQLNSQIKHTFVQRAYLIKPFVALQIIISLVFLLLVFLKKKWLSRTRPLILASMIVPLVLLILSIFSSDQLSSKYLWLIILTAFLVVVTLSFRDTLYAVSFISLMTALGILVDLLRGAPLMKVSALGYDPIGGSRYYGLGNEYMGVLIGSLIIGLMAIIDRLRLQRWGHYLTGIIFFITFYLILSPSYGSNVGGTISAFGAFSVTLLLTLGVKIRLKHVGIIGLGLIAALIVLFLVISPHNPPSHISKTVDLIKTGGIKSIFLIIARKLSMNYKLLKYTVWTRALLTSIAVIVALLYRPPYLLKKIFQKNNTLYYGFIGTGVGCLLALIFNDSGIVAAATMMIFIALPVMLLVIDEIEGST